MKQFATYFCIPLFCIVLSSCVRQPDDTTPPPSTTSKPIPIVPSTFSCKVNGKLWVANGDLTTIAIRIALSESTVNIIAEDAKGGEGLTINLRPIIDTGIISFPSKALNIAWGRFYKNNDLIYNSDSLDSGYIHFSEADYQKGVFKGTFEFNLYNNSSDTLHITDGKFYVKK